ncbi:uncharacterized protein LOC102803888, partial [Saccoglossus kowalevskii]|uniref:Enolase-phosphatase E1-like n=1 Tax=Saccoglossus kowalevskii TaxID=10224 RepID=A0ABM0M9G0_SACKO
STFDAEEPHSELVDTVLSVLHKGTAGSDCDSEDSTERHVVQNDWIIGDDDSNLTEVIDIAESVPSIQEKMTVSEDSEDVVVPLQIANKTEVEQTAINEVQPLVANDASFTGNVEATVKSGHLHNVSSTVKMIEDEVKSADCQTGCSQENKNENKMHSGDSSNVSSTAKKTEVEVKSGDCQTGSSTAKKTENKMHSGDSPNVSLTAKKTEVEVKSGDCQTGSSTAKKTENKMHSGDSPNLSSTAKKTEVEVKSGDCQTGSSTAKKNENKMHSGDSPNLSSTAKEKENMEQSGDSDTIISTSKNEENERTSNTNNDNSFGNKDVNLEQSAFLNNINISSILPNLRKSIDLILNEEKKNLEVEQNKSPTVSTSDVESSVKVEKDKQISRGNMKQGDRKSTKDVGVEPSRQSKRFHPYGKGKRTTEQEPSPGPVVTQELHTLMKNLTAKNYLATKSEKPIKLMNNFYDMPAGSSPARFRTCDVPSRLRRNTTSGSESSESTVKNEGDERVQKNDSRKVRSKDFISKLSLYDSIVNSRQEMDADDVYETEGKIYSNPSMAVQREQHAPAPSRQRLLMGGMSHTGRNIPTLQEGECKQTHIKDSSLPPVIKTPIGLVSTTGDHKVQTISLSCNNKPGIGQTTHSGQDIHSNLINSSSSSSSRCITNDSINNDSRCYITTSTITTTTTLAFNAHNHHTSGGAEDSNLSNLVFGCGDGKTVNESMMQDDFNCIPMDLDDECQDYNINSQEKKKHTFVKDKHSKLRSRINTSRDPRLQKRHPTMPEPDREAKENIVDLTETEGIKDILRSSRQLEAVSKRSRPLSLKSSSDIIQSVRQRARTEVENTDIESPNIKEAYRSLSNLCSRIKEEHKIGPVGGDCKEVVENSAGLVHQLSDVNTEERIRSWLDSMEPDHGEAHEEEKKDNQQTSGADVVPDLDDLTSATFEPAVTKKKKIRISFSQYKNKAKEAESVEIEEGTVKNKLPVSLTVHLKRKITHGIEGPEKIKCQVETSFGMAGKYGNGVHATAEVSPVLTNTDETVKCAATEPSSVQTSFGSNGECPFLEKRETSQSIEDAGEIMCTFQKTSKDESASEVPSSKKIESSFWTDFGSNIGEGSIFEKNQIPFLNISCTSGQKGVSPSLMESRIDPRKNDKSQTLLSDERGNAEEVMEILSDDRGNDEGVTEELKTEPQHLDNIFSFTKFDQGIENNKETNVTHKDMCPGSKTDSLLKAITFNIKDDVYALLKTVSGTFIKKDAAIRIPSDRTSEPDFDTEDCVLIENAPSGEKHKVDAASAFSPETDTSDWPITGKTKETFCAAFTEMKLVMFEALISHGEELCNLLDGGSVNLYFSDNLQLKPLSHDYGNNTWKDTSVCFTLEEAKHQFQEELDEAWDVVFERTSNYSTGNTGSEINILEHACEQYDESEQSQEENSQQYTNKNFEPVEIKSLSASTIKKEVISKPGSKIVISLSGAFPKEEVLEGKKGEAKIQEGFSIPVQHTRQMINTLPTMRKKKHECQLKPVPPSSWCI